MTKDLLSLLDFKAPEIETILKSAHHFKSLRGKKKHPKPLEGKTLAMIFEKSSTRTRVSFEVAMFELGGHALNLTSQESQLGRGESYEDTARVLSRYVHGIMIRTFSQRNIELLAQYATIPVINGLSDLFHPVQILADLMTIQEEKGDLSDLKIAYVGDGNNLANSWIEAAVVLGFELNVACPKGYAPSGALLTQMSHHPNIAIMNDPLEAVKSADVIYTDTWFSMGQKVEDKKRKAFAPFQINTELLTHAASDAIVLHCLPAHRGEEITDEVMDGPQSRVFEEAENRLHVQKAILAHFLA